MSVIGSNILAGASGQGGGYNLTRSLRFRSSASAYLSRTPASAGNRKTWTLSTWIKRSSIGSDGWIMSAGTSGSTDNNINFTGADDTLACYYNRVTGAIVIPSMKFRDPSAWYHVIIAVDTTQATASNRVKVYVNGVQVTSFQSATYPSQNEEASINNNVATYIGARSSGNYFDGYLAETNFIDGQALTPSSFCETSSTTGVWQPKRYTGTYGTNGFYLPFSDNTSTTTLGADSSGNGNNWTCNNISLTTGSTYDSMVDVPTQPTSSSDTYPPSNYAVFNPIAPASQTNSEANLKVSTAAVNATPATIFPSSGKWYAEIALVSGTYHRVGICNTAGIANDLGGSANGWCYLSDGRIYNNGSTTSYGVSSTNGDIINIALDLDAGKIWYGKNGTWMSSGSPSTGANPSQTFTANQSMSFAVASGSGTIVYTGNFGQRPFAYTPPTGFVALNTYNLPTPTIGATASSQANKYFDVATWTGANTNGGNSVSSLAFSPDLVWTKIRSQAYSHLLYDRLRGTGATAELSSDQTVAEGGTSSSERGYLNSFDTNGFSSVVGSNGDNLYFNQTSQTYVAWNWKANGSGSSNTSGSITSTVSANTTSGFSIVTYTGNGTGGATVGHGLGVAPSMVIIKDRVDGVADWRCYHVSLGNTKGIFLNLTNAAVTDSSYWNNTTPSSTVVTLGTNIYLNASGHTYVAYCFSEVQGYSKFGSYTGNGSSDGTFVYTGFRPRFVMYKRTDAGTADDAWVIIDTARDRYNVATQEIYANYSNAEGTAANNIDILSNGFKARRTQTAINASGGNYIYMAFAENPFKYSLAR